MERVEFESMGSLADASRRMWNNDFHSSIKGIDSSEQAIRSAVNLKLLVTSIIMSGKEVYSKDEQWHSLGCLRLEETAAESQVMRNWASSRLASFSMSEHRFTFAVQRLPAGPSYAESFQDQTS